MTTKITIENTESNAQVHVRKFETAANGERHADTGPMRVLQPGEKLEEYIHGSAMVEVTEGPFVVAS